MKLPHLAWTALTIFALPAASAESAKPHAGMLRYPDVSATHIAFVYANDLWVVPRAGGQATPLASPPGPEALPKFSADGQQIAFIGNYEGNPDIYTVPLTGGVPQRVTHHPAAEFLCDWTPEGKLLFSSNGLAGLERQTQLFTVDAAGGLPEKLPLPYGINAAVSPDGQWLAYTPHSIDQRTWKRYRGGMATDIWLFNLQDKSWKPVTDWEGTDSLPMWHGSKLYYLSDQGPEHRLNIWVYDLATGAREQVTRAADFDVKYPSIGPGAVGEGEIVFQLGPELHLLNLATREHKPVEIIIPGDRPTVRPRRVEAGKFLAGVDASPTGKRAVVEARGDLWSVPAAKGSVRNLTRTPGVAERDPAWSPDGRWIAYLSDATGEYELYLTPADGNGETKQLTHDGKHFRYRPMWSPDSKHIVFTDKTGAMYLHRVDGETKLIDTDPWGEFGLPSWSHDSGWLAYAKGDDDTRNNAIWLYELAADKKQAVTRGMFNDSSPAFDRAGKYLFLSSSRKFNGPTYEDNGTTFIYTDTEALYVVPLRKDVPSPFAPKSDEESVKDDKSDAKKEGDQKGDEKKGDDEAKNADQKDEKAPGDKSDDKGDKKDEKKAEPLKIDLDGFERRMIALPLKQGLFGGTAVTHDGKLVFTRRGRGGRGGAGAETSIMIYELPKDDDKPAGPGDKLEKTVVEGAGAFGISADGKKLIVLKGDTVAIVDAAPDQKLDKPIDLGALVVTVDPKVEWRQMVNDAWRIERDYFYDPTMHGVDWAAVRDRYLKMLDDCASREDVNYLLGEMIAELNCGHTYVRGGDTENSPTVPVGLLGCDYELTDGAYKISRIIEGAPWDVEGRGPLSQPGVDVAEGDYLLAVNGVPLDAAKDPWSALVGLADKTVTLTVSKKPTLDGDARQVNVTPLGSERELRYRDWIERNRAYVEKQSGGKIGYIYVPNTGVDGQNDLVRQFIGQRGKAALIIDERWNGGGQIPTRFIELLNRPITNYWARRDGKDWPWPPDSHQGPKCMLINGLAGSGGDAFPAYFRQAGLGKLIGRRTWGGLVGISGNPSLIDRGGVTAPTFAFYENDGTWGIEGHGVDPDIEVLDDPSKMTDGGDPQLDAAIAHMKDELAARPYKAPARPKYADRKGMGIKEEDK